MKNNTNILVVEDSPTQAEKLKFILEDENYFVTMAYNGIEALNFLNNAKELPDLIITDIVMPGMNGYELTKNIKSDNKLKEIPVILLTSLSDPNDILKGLESGANNFISKPYEEKFMLERVEYFLLHNKITKTSEKKGYIEFMFKGEKHFIPSDSRKVLGFLISSYETAVDKNLELSRAKDELIFLNTKLDDRVKERTAKLLEEIDVREKIEEQLFHVNSVLKAIRNVNQLITHERNPKVLIREACNKLVEGRGYSYARIVTLDKKQKINDFAYADLNYGKSAQANEIKLKELSYCMENALFHAGIFIFDKSQEECTNCQIVNSYTDCYTVSLRLEFEGKIHGILSVSIHNRVIFDKEEESLFRELADDISFALASIEMEEEKKRTEESLLESDERYSTIVNNSPNMILIHKDGIIKYINGVGEDLIGYSKEETVGKTVMDFLAEDSKAIVMSNMERRAKGENIPPYEAKIVDKFGNVIPMLIQATLIYVNKERAFLAVLTDISEIKKYQEELIIAKEEAEKLSEIKGNFLANMSHEMRTPMIGILGFAKVLESELHKVDQKDMAKMIVSSGDRLMNTLNLILDLSAIESNKVNVCLNEVSIPFAVYDSTELYKPVATRKNLYLQTNIIDEELIANLDESMLNKILNNLINNAIKYTDIGGITVEVDSEIIGDETNAVIRIIDTGIGIPKEFQEVIFEEFRQVSEGISRNFDGTGIGLTITKKNVEIMNGTITVDSEVGKGSTFTVKFAALNYISKKIVNIVKEASTYAEPKLIQEPTLKKILLVEDDLISRMLTEKLLKELCQIDIATNGDKAIELAGAYNYPVILMDINLGRGKNGLEVIEIIRQMPQYENTPIIAMTAFAMKGDREEFLSKGCSDYISKPFTKENLVEKIDKILKILRHQNV